METGKIINRISNRLRRRAQSVQSKLGIGTTQGNILDYILIESRRHPVYQKDLEQEFGLRASTVTEMLKSLEFQGLITRLPDEQDARYKKIMFTSKAASMKDQLRREIEQSEQILLQGIGEEELARFMCTANKMLQNLDGSDAATDQITGRKSFMAKSKTVLYGLDEVGIAVRRICVGRLFAREDPIYFNSMKYV